MQNLDNSIVLFFQSIRFDALTSCLRIFVPLDFWNWAALALVVYFFVRTRVLQVPLIPFFLARELSQCAYDLLKDHFQRPRPYLGIKGAVPVMTAHGFSFPSGHSTLAMAMAVVLSQHFPRARVLIYTVAVLIGLSRVYFGVHYPSDVLGGFVLGALVGGACLLLEKAVLALAKGVRLGGRSK